MISSPITQQWCAQCIAAQPVQVAPAKGRQGVAPGSVDLHQDLIPETSFWNFSQLFLELRQQKGWHGSEETHR